MNYWLVKSEPFKFSFEQLLSEKFAVWDGVRNFQARNNLREMKKGDVVLFYHSNEGKEIVGIAKVVKESYQDPTTEDPNWLVVNLKAVKKLKYPVSLAQIKKDERLENIGLVRQSRLSVINVSPEHYDIIISLSKTKSTV